MLPDFLILTTLVLAFTGQTPVRVSPPEGAGHKNSIRQGESFKKISFIPSFPYADGWLGGDGALSVQLSDTRVLWILSDSYVSHKPDARKRKKAWTIVNNVVALSDYKEDPASMHYYWKKARKDHRAFFEPRVGNYFFWPSWAFLRQDTVYVLMNMVENMKDADPGEVFNFRHRGISLAAITALDRTDPLQWDVGLISYEDLFPNESFMQAGTDDTYLYVFKHMDQQAYLTRIPLNALLQPQDAIEYLAMDGVWKQGTTGEDSQVLFTGQANGSLEYYPDLGHWLYVYGPNFLSNEIRYRTAKQISGPWSAYKVLYRTPEQTPGDPAYDERHFCYLARTHSAFYNSGSGKLLLTYDCNSIDFFHAAGSDFIYIPRVLLMDVPPELK